MTLPKNTAEKKAIQRPTLQYFSGKLLFEKEPED